MKTLIFEGIATSGKSTIAGAVVRSMDDSMSVELATEERTHVPIMAQRSELHLDFFAELIGTLAQKRPDLLIFDRLYITQAYRAGSGLAAYSSIETVLLPYAPRTIVLKVAEDAIAARIAAASRQRGQKWQEYLRSKGGSLDQIAQSYIDQQRGILRLITESNIPYSIFDTTDHDYTAVMRAIVAGIRD